MNRSPLSLLLFTWLILACGHADAPVESAPGGSGDGGSDAPIADTADASGDEEPPDAPGEDGSVIECPDYFEGLAPLSTCGWTGENGSPYDIWGSSADDIYVVGRYGYAAHYDGVRWSKLDLGTSEDLQGVWGSSSSNVFITGTRWVYRFDGTSWGRQQVDGKGLEWVRGLPSCEVFGYLEEGALKRFDGHVWSDFPAPASEYPYPWWLTDVGGSSSSDLYVAGYILTPGPEGPSINGIVAHYDGTAWTRLLEVNGARLNAIAVASPNDIHVVGGFDHAGLWLHYDGNSWESAAEPDAELMDIWRYSATDVYAAGFGGTVVHCNGTECEQVAQDLRALRIEHVFGAPDRIWFAAINGVGYLDGGELAFSYWWPNWTSLYALAGTSNENLYAFGGLSGLSSGPAGLRYDGEDWTWLEMPAIADEPWLFGAWAVSDDEVYAVGQNSTILRYDGEHWTEIEAPEPGVWLMSAWASSANDVFLGGGYGKMFHFDGAQWSTMDSGTEDWVRGISGTAPDNVFAVTDTSVLHFDGSMWSQVSDTGARAVWAADHDHIFAATQKELLRYANGSWETVHAPAYSPQYGWIEYKGLWASSAADVWVVGHRGATHFDGTEGETTTGLPSMEVVWGDGSGNLVAAGAPTMVRYMCQ